MFLFQPSSWKDTYIRSLVTLAGPWGGTVRALKVIYIYLSIYLSFYLSI